LESPENHVELLTHQSTTMPVAGPSSLPVGEQDAPEQIRDSFAPAILPTFGNLDPWLS
jgi:hypothetical protein